MKIGVVLVVVAGAALSGAGLYWTRLAGEKQQEDPKIVSVAWNPPATTIDSEYIAAAKKLLGNGLGDPRGGQFSKVELTLGNAAWSRGPTEGFGWVSTDGTRVTLLDGVEYPLTSRPVPADLETATDSYSERRTAQGKSLPMLNMPGTAMPALLLLVGRVDLAEKAFARSVKSFADNPSFLLFNHLRQRYQMLAAEDLMTRKDREGLARAEKLLVVAKVQNESQVHSKFDFSPKPESSLKFARALLSDFHRRVENPKHEPIDVASILKLDRPRRVAALIENLDTVSAKQMSQPGGVDYFNDPVVKALAEQGPGAVPALIDVLEKDERYARTVSFGRDFAPDRSIHSVRDVAWALITFIWPSSGRWEAAEPALTARALREAWPKQADLTQSQRWLDILRDDKAGGKQWLLAAQYLVKPSDEVRHGMWMTISRDPKAPMTGEELRPKHNADVIRLLGERATQMAAIRQGNSMDVFSCADALRVGHCLAKWELASSTSCLRAVCTSTLATAEEYMRYVNANDALGGPFGVAIADRSKAGDYTAAADYAKYLGMVKPEGWFSDAGFFRALWASPADAAIQRVGEEYMERWGEDISSGEPKVAQKAVGAATMRLLESPLLGVSSYRHLLIRGLENSHSIGVARGATQGGQNHVAYTLEGGGGGNWGISSSAGSEPVDGSEVPMTVGDYLAQTIFSSVKGAPTYLVLWSERKRADARANMIAWLHDDKRDWMAVVKLSPFFQFNQVE